MCKFNILYIPHTAQFTNTHQQYNPDYNICACRPCCLSSKYKKNNKAHSRYAIPSAMCCASSCSVTFTTEAFHGNWYSAQQPTNTED